MMIQIFLFITTSCNRVNTYLWIVSRISTSETLSAREPESDPGLTQNLFVGSPHASHLIYSPAPAPVVTGHGRGQPSPVQWSISLLTPDNVPTPPHTVIMRGDRSVTSWAKGPAALSHVNNLVSRNSLTKFWKVFSSEGKTILMVNHVMSSRHSLAK